MTLKDGEQGEVLTEKQHLQRILKVSEMDPRPILLYFHYDHEHEKLGKPTLKQCKSLDDEKVARWSMLYHCVEVDMDKSDTKIAARLGGGERPSFAVVNNELEVLGQAAGLGSGKAAISFLRSTLKKGFPEYWKEIDERLDEQKAAMQRARKLAKQKKYDEALNEVAFVRGSDLRIGDFWDDAAKEAQKLEKQIRDG